MKTLTLSEIAQAVNGNLNNPEFSRLAVSSTKIDSRGSTSGSLFVAIKGDNHDGHDYIEDAFNNGAAAAVSNRPVSADKPVIYVADTRAALRDLAEYYISTFNLPVTAITGSTGKTTTKDLITQVLNEKYKTLKNIGNFNNEIGLPLSVLELDDSFGAAVFEMGMSGTGEIRALSKVVRPGIAVITNIGYAHLETLKTRDNIFKAKREIFDYLKEDGAAVLNGDDEYLKTLKLKNAVFYGFRDNADIFPSKIEKNGLNGTRFNVNINIKGRPPEKFETQINTPGDHMIYNVLAAAAVGTLSGLTAEQIKTGISKFESPDMRMSISAGKNGITLINDAYNSNPASAAAALNALSQANGARKVCILGDMLELGESAERLHYETGRLAAENADVIICAGTLAKAIYDGAEPKQRYYYEKKEELIEDIAGIIAPGDVVLVKASRSMGFEEIANALK